MFLIFVTKSFINGKISSWKAKNGKKKNAASKRLQKDFEVKIGIKNKIKNNSAAIIF